MSAWLAGAKEGRLYTPRLPEALVARNGGTSPAEEPARTVSSQAGRSSSHWPIHEWRMEPALEISAGHNGGHCMDLDRDEAARWRAGRAVDRVYVASLLHSNGTGRRAYAREWQQLQPRLPRCRRGDAAASGDPHERAHRRPAAGQTASRPRGPAAGAVRKPLDTRGSSASFRARPVAGDLRVSRGLVSRIGSLRLAASMAGRASRCNRDAIQQGFTRVSLQQQHVSGWMTLA